MTGDIKFPLVDIRQNLEGIWEVVEITQNITVPSSGVYVARLNELPDNGDISGNLPSIDGLTLANTYSPESGQFGVKYSTGDVIFNSAQAGQTFSITYYGKGTLIEAADINYLYDVSLPIGASGGQFARWDETTERWILIDSDYLKWNETINSFELDKINFDTTYTPSTHTTGNLHWNAEDETLELDISDEVGLQIGQELYVRVKNASGQILNSGDVVYPIGSTGDNAEADLAIANSYSTSRPVAVVTQEIGVNQIGFVTIFGSVRNLDTTAWNEGDLLYLSPFTPGALTNIKPSYPNFATRIAVVVRKHANNGFIIVDSDCETDIYTHGGVLFGNGNGEIGEDPFAFFWDNENDRLGIGINTPTHTLQVSGDVKFGNNTHYSEFEDDGTLTMSGSASVWKDINLGGVNLTQGNANNPDKVTIDDTNIITYAFDGGTALEEVHGAFELQHDYKEGTDLWPHIHYYPTTANTGNVKWFLEYYLNYGGINHISGTTSVITPTNSTAWEQFRVNFDDIIDGTNFIIGTQIHFRLYRDPNDVEDTYTDDVAIATVGIHYEIDTIGSRQITSK